MIIQTAMTENGNNHSLILFDGVCNFCNSSVNFVIDRDKENIFKFASLQSDTGQKILRDNNLPLNEFNTFLLMERGLLYTKSTAAIKVTRYLGGAWKLLYVFIIIPPVIRNFFYDLIARNRYKWFGKKDSCRIPTPEERAKFLV
ncbi:MAG: thiol-disulfide oxidoreductase DCC family protein [Ignavibacteriae bacterium]|nr:thiol-disulfide oxidoreductase DCC family protein [Ignavibacteriota bacterium]